MAIDHERSLVHGERIPTVAVSSPELLPALPRWKVRAVGGLGGLAPAVAEGCSYVLLSREEYLKHRLLEPAAVFGLTPRELEVAELWARGWEVAEIAAELGPEPSTVRHHLNKARKKTGARNGRELTWALVFGRLPVDRPPPRSPVRRRASAASSSRA